MSREVPRLRMFAGPNGSGKSLLKDAGWKESDVPALLGSLDEDFLPDVDLDHGNLNYTVVIGEVLGNFEAQKK